MLLRLIMTDKIDLEKELKQIQKEGLIVFSNYYTDKKVIVTTTKTMRTYNFESKRKHQKFYQKLRKMYQET